MELSFDRILHLLGDVLKSEMFTSGEGITQRAFG
jgi:hypothetical protein